MSLCRLQRMKPLSGCFQRCSHPKLICGAALFRSAILCTRTSALGIGRLGTLTNPCPCYRLSADIPSAPNVPAEELATAALDLQALSQRGRDPSTALADEGKTA
jgi:hypothetical protein